MKSKILPLILLVLTININAQDSEDATKNFRFGLKGNLDACWLSPDNEREFSSDGVGIGYGWGLQMEFKLGKTTSLATGIDLSTFSAGLNYSNTDLSAYKATYYSIDNNFDFVDLSDMDSSGIQGAISHQLLNRKYKLNYVNVPFALKMKTKEIGYLTYFGEFGANIAFKTKAKVDDICNAVAWDTTSNSFADVVMNVTDNTDLDVAKGTQAIRAGILVGAGAEYNISGTTSMFFSLHYNLFITNMITSKKNEKYLRQYDSVTGSFTNVGAKSIPGSVSLTVGVLF